MSKENDSSRAKSIVFINLADEENITCGLR